MKINIILVWKKIKINIISTGKKNSTRFTKFNAILHNYNKNKDLILLERTNTVIYLSNKKNPINVEYLLGVLILLFLVLDY